MPADHDARLALARHFRRNAGWLTVSWFNSANAQEIAARDAMLADGHLVADLDANIRRYILTAAGAAWLAEREQQ